MIVTPRYLLESIFSRTVLSKSKSKSKKPQFYFFSLPSYLHYIAFRVNKSICGQR